MFLVPTVFDGATPGCGVGPFDCGVASVCGTGAGCWACCGLSIGCPGDGDVGVGEETGDDSEVGVGGITRDSGGGSYPRGGKTRPEGIAGDGKTCTGGRGH